MPNQPHVDHPVNLTGSNPRREIRGYDAVRNAARDYETYSSDLLGDRDVRTYRQLPLEADPPRHTAFREALQPLFMSAAIEPHVPRFEELAERLIRGISARGGGDIVSELALPYVIGCLTIIYNRPQDYDEWLSWGPDVWIADAYARGEVTPESQRAQRERDFSSPSQRSGATLQAYLDRVFDEARRNSKPGVKASDVWLWVSQLSVDGKGLTRDEMLGIGNVLLAGGRDTVIKLITGLTWHLVKEPVDRDYLASNPSALNRAVAEMVRFLSPLPKMERVLADDRTRNYSDSDASRYVLLNFMSANHDRTAWKDPDKVELRRARQPHLAFGFGRHSCMGMNITEYEAKAFLRILLDQWPRWRFAADPDIEWIEDGPSGDTVTFIDRFNSVWVTPN